MNAKTPQKPQDETAEIDWQAWNRAVLSKMEAAYLKNHNPIYVFLAILWRDSDSIPNWCVEYLEECAERIQYLAANLDPQTGLPTGMAWSSPATKAKELLRILGFLKPGWNAFERYSWYRRSAFIADDLRQARQQSRLKKGTTTQGLRGSNKKPFKQVIDELIRRDRISRSRLYARAAEVSDLPSFEEFRRKTRT